MVLTAPRTPAPAITRPPGRTHAVPQFRTVTAPKVPVKRTTQRLGHTLPRSKAPTPMAAGEARRFQKTATLPTASIKRLLKEPRARYKPRTAARQLVRRGSTTVPLWLRPQTATSMRQRTATPTRTRAAAGRTRTEVQLNPAVQASSSAASKGYGGQEKSGGSSAFSGSGGGGWESRSASARGSASRGGGGGRR